MRSDLYDDALLSPIPLPDPQGIRICNTELRPCGHVLLASKMTFPWRDKFASTRNVAAFARAWLGSPVNARYAIIHVGTGGFFHRAVNLTYGGRSPYDLRPAEILRTWMNTRSLSAIIVHTHADENLEPDARDLEFTHELSHLADLMGMQLLDHLIVGNFEGFLSMKEKGFFV